MSKTAAIPVLLVFWIGALISRDQILSCGTRELLPSKPWVAAHKIQAVQMCTCSLHAPAVGLQENTSASCLCHPVKDLGHLAVLVVH